MCWHGAVCYGMTNNVKVKRSVEKCMGLRRRRRSDMPGVTISHAVYKRGSSDNSLQISLCSGVLK